MSFANKVVLITGGGSGIGAATAIFFTREGADVAIVGRNETKLANVADQCAQNGKKPIIIRADVTKDDEAKTIVEKTINKFGKLDILVNNAGILRTKGILEDDYIESFDEVMNTNVRAVVLVTNLAAPHLIKTKGNIVIVSSVAGSMVSKSLFSSYKVSKAAIDHFTRTIALELASAGVRVNAVNPGPVQTEIFDTAGIPDAIEIYKDFMPLRKVADAEEVADLILFLASEKARSVTGSLYVIDNGMLLK